MATPTYSELVSVTSFVNNTNLFVLVYGFQTNAAFSADGDSVQTFNSNGNVVDQQVTKGVPASANTELFLAPKKMLCPPQGKITSTHAINIMILTGTLEDLRGYA